MLRNALRRRGDDSNDEPKDPLDELLIVRVGAISRRLPSSTIRWRHCCTVS